jgi:hypothetical protein
MLLYYLLIFLLTLDFYNLIAFCLTLVGGKLKTLRASKQSLLPMCSQEIQNIHHPEEEVAIITKSMTKMVFEEVQYELDFAISRLLAFIDSLDTSVYALMKVCWQWHFILLFVLVAIILCYHYLFIFILFIVLSIFSLFDCFIVFYFLFIQFALACFSLSKFSCDSSLTISS